MTVHEDRPHTYPWTVVRDGSQITPEDRPRTVRGPSEDRPQPQHVRRSTPQGVDGTRGTSLPPLVWWAAQIQQGLRKEAGQLALLAVGAALVAVLALVALAVALLAGVLVAVLDRREEEETDDHCW